jgi:hypothetical protein
MEGSVEETVYGGSGSICVGRRAFARCVSFSESEERSGEQSKGVRKAKNTGAAVKRTNNRVDDGTRCACCCASAHGSSFPESKERRTYKLRKQTGAH